MTDLVAQLVGALEDLLIDMKIAQSNMRRAAKRDPSWEGCAEAIQPRVDAAQTALSAAKDGVWVAVPVDVPRNREDDRARFPDQNFNRWLDEAITENGEYTAWHALKSTGDAYAGWCVRPDYTPPEPDGYALVPVQPTPEMIEAARDVKRQRLVRAATELKQGKRPDTIGMALSVNEEWSAMLSARPLPNPPKGEV